jgi:tRNA A-37 threonylcarbamoyl transferase component Bud32
MVISEPTAPVPPRYRLIEEVGQGGMAVVYRAKDDSLKREVAIKVLHRHLSSEPESKARLEREAQAVAKLHHDNILEIFDYSGVDAESAYIVTELIHGETLKQFLGRRGIRHSEVAMLIAAELCGALAHAHGMGIIHRDIKPENVMIRDDGLLKLMDFGIAQVLDLERMTVTGQLLGSPAYMAPELVEGRQLDVRTDVFSVGILLYQMATGVLPFSGKNPHEVLRRISEGRFPDPRGLNRLVGAGLARIMTHALARDPDARYPDMATLLGDLREQLDDAGVGTPRAELAAFFGDPEAYEKALPNRMTPALVATAERQLAARNSARAMECWNRVLAYAPDHPDVSAALRRFQGRGRRRRVAAVGGGAALGLGLVMVALRWLPPWPAPARPLAPGASAGERTGPRTTGAHSPVSVAKASAAGEGAPTGAPNPMDGSSTWLHPEGLAPGDTLPPTRPSTTTAGGGVGAGMLGEGRSGGARPPRTRPALERAGGEGAGEASSVPSGAGVGHRAEGPATASMMRTFGPHQIEFRSPSGCCFVERVEIGPDKPVPPENVIARKLKWRPARLIVTTQPPSSGVRIMVRDPARPERGTVVGPGEEANIPFLASDEAQKDIDVSVLASGGMFAERVVVRAGERKAVVVSIERGGGGPAAP